MLELVKQTKKVKVGDETFEMSAPTYQDEQDYNAKIELCKSAAERSECLFDYIETMGMPKVTAKKLQIGQVMQIMSYLNDEKKT